jgi:hypothetical protein
MNGTDRAFGIEHLICQVDQRRLGATGDFVLQTFSGQPIAIPWVPIVNRKSGRE